MASLFCIHYKHIDTVILSALAEVSKRDKRQYSPQKPKIVIWTFTQKHTCGYTFSYHNMSSHAAKVHTHMRFPRHTHTHPNINTHPLLYSTENSAQRHWAAWMGGESGRTDTCVCMAESLCSAPETITMQLISYASCSVTQSCVTVTPWTGAHWAPLSMGFPRQEYWSGLPCPSPGDLSYPRIIPMSPALAGGFFTTEQPGKPVIRYSPIQNKKFKKKKKRSN